MPRQVLITLAQKHLVRAFAILDVGYNLPRYRLYSFIKSSFLLLHLWAEFNLKSVLLRRKFEKEANFLDLVWFVNSTSKDWTIWFWRYRSSFFSITSPFEKISTKVLFVQIPRFSNVGFLENQIHWQQNYTVESRLFWSSVHSFTHTFHNILFEHNFIFRVIF